jgi:anti-sigma B factor antagonist
MNLANQKVGDIDVIEVQVKSLDADTAKEFRRDMDALLPHGGRVVLDVGALEFVDSSGLGAMLSCLRQLNAAGGDLKLCNMSKTVRAMFELVRMHRVIEIHDTRDEAVAAF